MTICDKINDVGETLQENLNNRGVDCTFGTGTGESTVLEMVEMVNGTNFRGSSDVNLKIGANRPYLLENETTDVVVKLENGLCEPLKNKNVTIEQSVFIDNGTTASHNDNWSNSEYMTRDDTGTTISNTGTGTLFEAVRRNNSNLGFANTSYVVEFEIVENPSSTNRFRFDGQTICTGETYQQQDVSFSRNETGKFRFVYNKANNTILKYKNGTYVSTYNHQFCGNMGFLFRLESGASIKIKDFIIYEIINGVTDEKGEFALYNVSVSDDTIFNATYGTETATCLVEYCRFVDYAVKDNHNHNYFNQQGTSKCTITENDSYKEFKTIGAIGCNVYIGSSTSYIGFDVGNTWTIIWDKLYIDGYTVAFQCYNGSTSLGINSTTLNLHNSDFQELKFVCDGSSIKAYVDGVYKTQTSYTSTGHGYLRINLNNNNGASQVTFRAKNIRIK